MTSVIQYKYPIFGIVYFFFQTLLNGNVYELANEEALIDGYEASVYNYTVGSRFSYNCYTGILVQGSAHRTCGADMKWSGREPRCGGG